MRPNSVNDNKNESLLFSLLMVVGEKQYEGLPFCSRQRALSIIAALIYLRWVDVHEAEREAISIFDDENYEPLLPENLQWRNLTTEIQRLHDVLTAQIPRELSAITRRTDRREARGLQCLAPVLEELSIWSPGELEEVFTAIDVLRLETRVEQKALLQAFDSVIEGEVSNRHDGVETEPPWLGELVAELASPGEQLHVYDPCFGLANFLVALSQKFSNQNESINPADSSLYVSGAEINPDAYVIGLTRLALAGISDAQLQLGDSLEMVHDEAFYDLIVLNPPWGRQIDIVDPDRFPVPTDDSSLLFVQQALTGLKPAGKAVIIVPQGLLFRDGTPKDFREWLLDWYSVEAVISIPEGALRYTGIATAILIISQRDPVQNPVRLDTDTVRMFGTEGFIGPYHDMTRGLSSDQCRQIAMIANMDGTELENLQAPNSSSSGSTVQKHAWDVSLKELEEVEWDLTPRRGVQSALKHILEALSEDLDVVPLNDVCTIFPGSYVKSASTYHSYDRSYEQFESMAAPSEDGSTVADRSRSESGLIPYIDKDGVSYGEVSPRRWFLTEDGLASFRSQKLELRRGAEDNYEKNDFVAKRALKGGDILISRSGKIGGVAVVGKTLEASRRRGALEATLGVGGIASRVYWVLRKNDDRLDPDYLAAYLQSKECQIWLNSRASGTPRSQLREGHISQMLIPVPSLSIQRRAIEAYELANEDVLVYLSEWILGSESDPIVDWMNGALEALSAGGNIHDLLGPRILGEAMNEAMTAESLSDMDDPGDLTHWFLSLKILVADPLGECVNVPAGLALYSLIKDIDQALEGIESQLVGSSSSTSKARAITEVLTDFVKNGLNGMLNSVEVGITARPRFHPDVVDVTLVELEIHNRGVLPLRNFKVVATPEGDSGGGIKSDEVGYIEADGVATADLFFTTSIGEGWTMEVDFSALRMDGSELNGKSQHALDLVQMSDESSEKPPTIGSSPYITGSPLFPKDKNVFYGRDHLLTSIKRQISSGNVVLLQGNRRTGKTSMLKHLVGDQAVEGWLGIYTSLQGVDSFSTVNLFVYLSTEIAGEIHKLGLDVTLPNGQILAGNGNVLNIDGIPLHEACRKGISVEAPFASFRKFFEVVVETLSLHKLKIFLMLDEFDKLQEGIDAGIISKEVPGNIRFLIQNFPGVSAALTGSHRLKRLQEEYWSALYGLGTRFLVSYLEEDAARKLVVEPVKGELIFAEAAINRVIYWTSCQPYLLQNLCNDIYEIAAQREISSITIDFVDQSAKQLVRHNPHFAQVFKDWVESDIGRHLLVLCHEYADGDDPFRLGVIENRLATDGLDLDSDSLTNELELLQELEVVDFESGVYKLAVPLLGLWISEEMDTTAVFNAAKNSHGYRDD